MHIPLFITHYKAPSNFECSQVFFRSLVCHLSIAKWETGLVMVQMARKYTGFLMHEQVRVQGLAQSEVFVGHTPPPSTAMLTHYS